jgi:predicted nuclease with TOPRIM domain
MWFTKWIKQILARLLANQLIDNQNKEVIMSLQNANVALWQKIEHLEKQYDNVEQRVDDLINDMSTDTILSIAKIKNEYQQEINEKDQTIINLSVENANLKYDLQKFKDIMKELGVDVGA